VDDDLDAVTPEDMNRLSDDGSDDDVADISSYRQHQQQRSSVDRQCLQCHATCASCVGQLTTDCVHCSPGLVWSHGRCLPTCDFQSVITVSTEYRTELEKKQFKKC